MAPITTLLFSLVLVSAIDFKRTEATAIPPSNQPPAIQTQIDTQKGLELIQDILKKAEENDENGENSSTKDEVKDVPQDALDDKDTKAPDAEKASSEEELPVSDALVPEVEVSEEAVEESEEAVEESEEAGDSTEESEESSEEATGAVPDRPWIWQRVINAARNTGNEAYACATDPIHLLRKFFPSLDAAALRNVGSFFKLFSVRSLFTRKVLNIVQAAVKGDFRPIIDGISNTLFAFKMQKISADGGYIGHKLTIKNPLKDVYIKYFINPSTIKLGVVMTGINAQVIDLKKLVGSSMNYICTPIPGIIGAYGCLRVEMKHPLHGIGNQVCMSGFMRYVFGDGPSMYFGCLKMNIPSIEGVAKTFTSGTDAPFEIEGAQDDQIQGLDLDDKEEDEGAVQQSANQDQTKSVFVGATDYLVDGITDILDRVDMSDEDKNTLNRAKQALANLMAFKDINGRLSVTPGFVTSLYSSGPAVNQSEEEINEKEGSESSEESGEAKEEDGAEVNKEDQPPKDKDLFFY